MRTIARISLVAAFATIALVGGCNKSARVESSAAKTETCNEGKTCEKASACCNSAAKAEKAPAAKQN
jgi:hypothetical protein